MSAVAAILLTARRLSAAEVGVNALLASLPTDPSDDDRPSPPPVIVCNECEDNWVQRATVPRQQLGRGALLLVLRDPNNPQIGATLGAPETADSNQANTPILIEYIAPTASPGSATAGSASGNRDAIDTMRTVERCLHVWFETTTQEQRTFAGATLVDGESVYHLGAVRELQGDTCAAALVAPLRVVDRWALNIST